jgi:hypothetical protein
MTIEGTEIDAGHLLGTGAATGVTGTRTHYGTARGVKHAAHASQGVLDGTAGLGVLLDVTVIETAIETAESETVRQPDFFLRFWLTVLTKYGVHR